MIAYHNNIKCFFVKTCARLALIIEVILATPSVVYNENVKKRLWEEIQSLKSKLKNPK
jgi:hypothetical protein